jgi:hypothetical protein
MRFAVLATFLAAPCAAAEPNAASVEFFEHKIRPVLAENCFSCHGARKQEAGLRLDSREGLLKGSDAGPVVVPSDPGKSKLIKAVRHEGRVRMPQGGKKLPADAIDSLTAWVKLGAPYPASAKPAVAVADARQHWAFQPVKAVEPPVCKEAVPTSIDRFVLAKLEAEGKSLAPPADKRTLIRRAYFDLIGLPPTAKEIDEFLADASPDDYEKLIDRLLASPHYGERQARHWLDLARYADTKGYVFTEDRNYPFAYTYRDWVVRAFNEDVPYDRFVTLQLAADRVNPADKRDLAAMGFLTLGRRFLNNTPDIIDDRIDVTCRTFLGLTVGCARCHDHKYDPIPAADYYSLYGVFASSVEPKDLPLIGEVERTPEVIAFETELKKREDEYNAFKAKFRAAKLGAILGVAGPANVALRDNERILNRAERNQLQEQRKKIDAFQAKSPVAPPRAMVLNDAPQPTEPYVFLRGNPGNHGPNVPRQFLSALSGPERKPFTDGSGRLELAKAIADPKNPLTARVLVNRVWVTHFGQGLIRTPSDFGTRSDPPTHPELLDWLAAEFVRGGSSVKKLHRLVMLSRTYRQASEVPAEMAKQDPENRLLTHQNRRRLDFEAMRDGMLLVAGRLDHAVGGKPVDLFKEPFPRRRSVYGFIDRQNLPGTLRVFDFAGPDQHSPQRFTTTVPQQALFLLNSPFVIEQARALAARPEVASRTQPMEKVRELYRAAYGRAPDADEAAATLEFVRGVTTSSGLNCWEQLAQVLLLGNEFAFVD